MLQQTAPKSLRTPATFTIKQGTVFSHTTAPYFHVEQGRLSFALAKSSPGWLSINSTNGTVIGKAPAVYTAKTFHVTVNASNNVGMAEWSFYLTVTREKFDHKVDAVIQRYFENKHQQRLEEYYTPELLEYIYAYLEQHHKAEFLEQLRQKATEFGMILSQQPSYEEFAKLVKLINPQVQEQLAKELPSDSPLPHAQVLHSDLQNLFRQGSQPLGVHAIPIFNYLAAPAQHVWAVHIKTIFNAAAVSLMQRQQAQTSATNSAVGPAASSAANSNKMAYDSIRPQPS
jgi:hypothetical protein